ncbi:hypothetical protein [Paraherbaspirillum soli]|uniref:Uncharacterized protein n=1 Tax=Paraherbaspirillum soli TaxID=631222 RepID=A0ABW0ME42_9BURK
MNALFCAGIKRHDSPAELYIEQTPLITNYVVKALTEMDVDNTPTHTEIILTAAAPRIIKTHVCDGGDLFPTLVQKLTGIDLYALSAWIQMDHALTDAQDVVVQAITKDCCGIRYIMPPMAGKLIETLLRRRLSMADQEPTQSPIPANAHGLNDIFSRTAYVRTAFVSRQELMSTLDRATDHIQYYHEESMS